MFIYSLYPVTFYLKEDTAGMKFILINRLIKELKNKGLLLIEI